MASKQTTQPVTKQSKLLQLCTASSSLLSFMTGYYILEYPESTTVVQLVTVALGTVILRYHCPKAQHANFWRIIIAKTMYWVTVP